MTDSELAKLIGRAQAGDPTAFDLLIDAYARRLHGYLYRLIGSRDEADDLVQEVFLRVVRMIPTYSHDGRFEQWLFRIAINLARDRIRKQRRTPTHFSMHSSDSDADDGGSFMDTPDTAQVSPDCPMMLEEQIDAVQQGLAQLNPHEREVIMLRHFSDMSFAQIAEIMGTPLGTALARAHRGLAKLKELLSEPEPTPE